MVIILHLFFSIFLLLSCSRLIVENLWLVDRLVVLHSFMIIQISVGGPALEREVFVNANAHQYSATSHLLSRRTLNIKESLFLSDRSYILPLLPLCRINFSLLSRLINVHIPSPSALGPIRLILEAFAVSMKTANDTE